MYNYNFMNDNWYRNTNVNQSIFSPTDGFDRGNLFSNLYSQYKNYKPAILRATNEQEQMLLDLSRLSFAVHELNLYLDLNPNDDSILALFNDYRAEADQLCREYEAKYGPLDINSNDLINAPFKWVNNSWPWEGKNNV